MMSLLVNTEVLLWRGSWESGLRDLEGLDGTLLPLGTQARS